MKKNLLSCLTILLCFTSLFEAYSQTYIANGQKVSGTWSRRNSPYIIQGVAIVPRGQSLVIKPGVTVKLKASPNKPPNRTVEHPDFSYQTLAVGFLIVKGKIIAEGKTDAPITFTRSGARGHWGGILLDDGSHDNSFDHCLFQYSYEVYNYYEGLPYTFPTLSLYKANAKISNCTFTNNYLGVDCYNSSPLIYKCIFYNNSSYGAYGYEKSTPMLVNCTFVKNQFSAVYCTQRSNIKVLNAIIWDNTMPFYVSPDSKIFLSHSLVQGSNSFLGNVDSREGIIRNKNPKFVNQAAGDFHLNEGSPAIKTGKKRVDMGAYPFADKEDDPNPVAENNNGPTEPPPSNKPKTDSTTTKPNKPLTDKPQKRRALERVEDLACGDTLELSHLKFKINQAAFMNIREAEKDLKILIDYLNTHPNDHVELHGHTDYGTDKAALLELSRLRVIAVQDYLTDHNIDEKRIVTKHFGGKHPVYNGRDPKQRAKNRRVEVMIECNQ